SLSAGGEGLVVADASITGTGSFGTNTDGRWYVLIAPPPDTQRIRVEGDWVCVYERHYEGGSTPAMTANAGRHDPVVFPLIDDDSNFSFSAPTFDDAQDEFTQSSGAFYAEWTKQSAGT